MTEEQKSGTPSQSELYKLQIDSHIELYKHHLDLFLKWITLYLAVVSALIVYIFNESITSETRRLLPLLIAIGSLVLASGCASMWVWIRDVEREVKAITERLQISMPSRFLGKRMTILVLVVSAGFAVMSALLYLFWGNIFVALDFRLLFGAAC